MRKFLFAVVCVVGASPVVAGTEPDADEVWKKTLAAYAVLDTYTDAGVVTAEYGSGGSHLRETHKFQTALVRPRQFLFAFDEDPDAGAERFVIWCDNAAFNSWWSATGVHETYAQGQGLNAFAIGSLPSRGSDVLIPALIFAAAGLQGPLSAFEELKSEGVAKLDGRAQFRISGVVREKYGTDYVSSERPTEVWIDAQSFLIRKVVQDTPKGSVTGVVDRVTTLIAPVAGTKPDPATFRFVVPKAQP